MMACDPRRNGSGSLALPETTGAADYVTLHSGPEEFAIPARRVCGIMRLQEHTPLEATVPFLHSVLNIRGRSVPVLDLAVKAGLKPVSPGPKTSVVIVDLTAGNSAASVRIGLLVDRVSEVFRLPPPNPERQVISPVLAAEWMLGTARVKRRQKTLIDLDRILDQAEMRELLRAF